MNKKNNTSPPKKRKRWVTVLEAVILVLLIVIAAGSFVFRYYYSKLNFQAAQPVYEIPAEYAPEEELSLADKPEFEGADEAELLEYEDLLRANLAREAEKLPEDDNVTNILLIGTDNRGPSSAGSRSDVMMIVSINSKDHRIALTSIMRDLYVKVHDAWTNRINTAYAIGGPQMLIDTIYDCFGITIHNYAQVDFESFVKVVDILGGIDVELTANEIYFMQSGFSSAGYPIDCSQAGLVHLNGSQALVYVRTRYNLGGDSYRTGNQRKFIKAMFEQHRDASLEDLMKIADQVFPEVTTDLTMGEVLSLILNAVDYLRYDIVTARIPERYDGIMLGGASMITADLTECQQTWYNAVYGAVGTD